MSDDPLADLKRDIEAERFGGQYAPPIPRARFELDRARVPRGENLSGIIVIEAGRRDLWLDRLDLFVAGMARSVGSPHSSTILPVIRHVNVQAGDSRSFPLWVQVPLDAPLGGKMMMVTGAPFVAVENFTVDPERHYLDLVEALEESAGVEFHWEDVVGGAERVLARLRSKGLGALPPGRLDLQVGLQGEEFAGTLVFEQRVASVGAAVRSVLRPNRQRIPFRIPNDKATGPEALVALLQAHLSRDRQLPVPAAGTPEGAAAEQLPVPSTSYPKRQAE